MFDPIDEFVMEGVSKYKDYTLVSVEKADLSQIEKFSNQKDVEAKESLNKEDEKLFDQLLRRIKDILGDRVNEVKESQRLTDSPACLVSPDGTMTSGMQRIMQLMNKDDSIPAKIMEINKDHALIRNLLQIYKGNVNDPHLIRVSEQLFESALLLEGYLKEPHLMVDRIEKILESSTEWYVKNQSTPSKKPTKRKKSS
jgi:molecular chaperone HtpG